ncbi:hypothetical protein PAL_GLEAN10005993 [Pteropus alecto]|uniref:Uncharacterized protein n=1 Tax=Pteropus alecto TaxID=9402 RepID=L5L8G2_PTEAL|nr:hypothetical protein PAL_GLEAN10005993 [Pteropus alecto]
MAAVRPQRAEGQSGHLLSSPVPPRPSCVCGPMDHAVLAREAFPSLGLEVLPGATCSGESTTLFSQCGGEASCHPPHSKAHVTGLHRRATCVLQSAEPDVATWGTPILETSAAARPPMRDVFP